MVPPSRRRSLSVLAVCVQCSLLCSFVGCGGSPQSRSWKHEAGRRVQSALKEAFADVTFDAPELNSITMIYESGNAQSMTVVGVLTVPMTNGEPKSFEYKSSWVVREHDKKVMTRVLMIDNQYAYFEDVDRMALPSALEPLVRVERIPLDGSPFP